MIALGLAIDGGVDSYSGAVSRPWQRHMGLALSVGQEPHERSRIDVLVRASPAPGTRRWKEMSVGVGWAFYPLTPSSPVTLESGRDSIRFSGAFLPFVSLGARVGRYLLETYGLNATLDTSTEFAALDLALGAVVPVTKAFSLDARIEAMGGVGIGTIAFRVMRGSLVIGPRYRF